jgi:hypothetical protein
MKLLIAFSLFSVFIAACSVAQTSELIPIAVTTLTEKPTTHPMASTQPTLKSIVTPKSAETRDSTSSENVCEVYEQDSYGDYTLRIFECLTSLGSFGSEFFEIWKSNERVYESPHVGMRYSAKNMPNKRQDELDRIAMGQDITGDGVPDLVVYGSTGGNHCCTAFYIFELGDEFKHLATLEQGWAEGASPNFIDLDGDSILEFVTADGVFAGWFGATAGEPIWPIILHLVNGHYQVAYDLMRKPAPSDSELATHARKVHDNTCWSCGEAAWGPLWLPMADLIYTGHANLAWRFLDMAWPTEVSGKTEFLFLFAARLGSSRYWRDIKKMNDLRP